RCASRGCARPAPASSPPAPTDTRANPRAGGPTLRPHRPRPAARRAAPGATRRAGRRTPRSAFATPRRPTPHDQQPIHPRDPHTLDRHRAGRPPPRRAAPGAAPRRNSPDRHHLRHDEGASIVDDQWSAEYGHEEFLQAIVLHVFNADALDQVCDDAGIPALLDAAGQPMTITDARTYRDAGVLTRDRGVLVKLSDGGQFGLTVTVSRRPSGGATLGPAGTRHHRP